MFGTHDLWLFIVSGFVLNVTPGPDNIYIAARSLQQGWRAGMVASLGIGCGVFVHVLAAALGLAALLAASAMAFLVVKLVGAAYLLWMFKRMFFGEVNPEVKEYRDMTKLEMTYMIPLCVAVIVFGIWPSPVLNIMKASVGQFVSLMATF